MIPQLLTRSALAAAVALALTACGGGTPGLAPDMTGAGALSNNILVGSGGVAAAGSNLSLQSSATAKKGPVTSHKWAVTQLSGAAVAAAQVPKILDTDCATAVKVTGLAPSPGSTVSRDGSSLCTTSFVVPDNTPNTQWVVTNTAASTAGTDTQRAVITVNAVSTAVGLSLSAASNIQAFVPNTPATLKAATSVKQGVVLDEPVSYMWTQVSGPAVTLAGADTQYVTFIPKSAGDYVFKVKASASANGRVDTKETLVVGTVSAPGTPNIALTVTAPTAPISGTLNMPVSASVLVTTSPDVVLDEPPTIVWSVETGTPYPLNGSGSSTVTFIPRTAEDFVLKATVTAKSGSVVQTKVVAVVVTTLGVTPVGDMALTVTAPKAPLPALLNTPVSASILVSTAPGVTLDAPPTIVWSVAGGTRYPLTGADSETVSFIPRTAEDFVLKATVTAKAGAVTQVKEVSVVVTTLGVTAPGDIALSVTAPSAPVAAALNTPVSTSVLVSTAPGVTLDAPPTILWSVVSGTPYPLAGANTDTVTFVPRTLEDFVLKATVTAKAGSVTQVKEVSVVVSALGVSDPANNPFEVFAGASQVVKTPMAVLLTGTIPTGVVGTYQWSQISGPPVVISNNKTLMGSFVGEVLGTYVFKLSVTANGLTRVALTTVFVGE